MRALRVACVQLNTRDDVTASVKAATELVERAAVAGARLVVLPETWAYKGGSAGIVATAEALDGPSNAAVAKLAARLGIYVLAGSIYEPSSRPDRVFNTSVLVDPQGAYLAVYRKIHLFDAVSAGVVYRESDDLEAGSAVVTVEVDGVAVGLSICYDLRFPELYRSLALKGAQVLLVPAAFTAYTGAAHWEVLLRARAVENTCFVAAADQVGEYLPGRASYGHSMIVDPWGTVLARAGDGVGICVADLDLERLHEVRSQIPSLANRRPEAYEL
jgi:deaminated glutathione amidase